MQDGTTTPMANYSINVLNEPSKDRLISCKVWPARCSDLNPCDIYLCENPEDKMYSNNLHTLDKFKYICETVTVIKVSEIKVMSESLFKRSEVCLRADRRHLSIYYDY
jgi:hypothetical protein